MTNKYCGVALVGPGGVGKTTAAAHLEQRFLLRRVHPKNLFGEMVAPILLRMGVPVDEIADRVFGSRIDEPLPPPFSGLTTRHLLQAAGGGFLSDVGVEGLAHMLTVVPGAMGLIESVRRPAEAAWLREKGWFLLRINRPGHEASGAHETEVDMSGVEVHAVVDNDRDIAALRHACQAAVSNGLGVPPTVHRSMLLVINGRPRSGKDSITGMLGDACRAHGIDFHFVSSIQRVVDMLGSVGIDTSAKSPRDRDLLAATKAALVAHGAWPTKWILRAYADAVIAAGGRRMLFVTHVREPDQISGLANSPNHVAMWVRRPGAPTTDAKNASDATKAGDYDYDVILANDGSLDDLRDKANRLLPTLFSRSLPGVA